MKRSEAEKLLGGYATGTLTTDERRALFTAALGHQAIFDALMDEELLRELLADPLAKAQLLAALATAPKVVPFWRRTGVLGAAASLLVASLAGIAYLRSPNAMPSVVRSATLQEPAAKVAEAPPAAQAPAATMRNTAPAAPAKGADQPRQEAVAPTAPAPAPKPLAVTSSVAAPAQEDSARLHEKADYRRAEAQDQLAKKAEAPRSAAAVAEVVSAQRSDAPERKVKAQDSAAGGVPGGVIGSVVSGVAELSPAPTAAKAKAVGGVSANAMAPATPVWTLEAQPDGRTRVLVSAPRGRTVVLLRRGATGVEVMPIRILDDRREALVQGRAELRLAAGDVLDLYLLNAPVAEPAQLPETGPVDGFRARIHPAAK
jgi:hypothetical protein